MSFFESLLGSVFPKKSNEDHTGALTSWEKAGRPIPPPHLAKQLVINQLTKEFQCRVFIETGTYLGEMITAQKNNFHRIYSIELSKALYKDAQKKFEKYDNITILQGDSGDVLLGLMPEINEAAIFWLDGHYSAGITAKGKKDCPIYEELYAIFKGGAYKHILLIDDARLFIGQNDYPTIDELRKFIKADRPQMRLFVKDDIIHCYL